MNLVILCKHNVNTLRYTAKRPFLLLLVLSLSAIPSMLIYCIISSFNDLSFPIGITLVTFFLWALIFILTMSNITKQSKKNAAANFEYCSHEFSETGMEIKSYNYIGGVNAFIPYEKFKLVYFDKQNLVLLDSAPVVYLISRRDISNKQEEELAAFFRARLGSTVFKETKLFKKSEKAAETVLSQFTPPVYTCPEVRTIPHKFDKNEENHFKTIRFTRKPKTTNPKMRICIVILIPFVFFCFSLIAYFMLDLSNDLLRLTFTMLWLVCMMLPLLFTTFSAQNGKDPVGRDQNDAIIEMSVNEFYLNYKITSGNSTLSFYYAISECQFIKETNRHFAFYIGVFQPMLLNKIHITPDQISLLQQILTCRYGNKYAYYNI